MMISEEGETAIAHADAEVTWYNRGALQQLVTGAVERGARTVIVDLGRTVVVDTAALGVLMLLASQLQRVGGAFWLANVNSEIRALLYARELDTYLRIGPPPPRAA